MAIAYTYRKAKIIDPRIVAGVRAETIALSWSLAGPDGVMSTQDPQTRAVSGLLRDAAASLDGESRRADAELLLAHAISRPRSWLYAHPDVGIGEQQARLFLSMVEQRRRGEPVALIMGVREFWSLQLTVTRDTLIPRPETELLVELALRHLPAGAPVRVLDLGTGTGAVALALAHERPMAEIMAIDIDARTLSVAHANAARLQLGRVRFLQGNWFSAVRDERYDVIVGNPPYIADDDPHLQRGDLRFEPRRALASGRDGLDAIRIIARDSPRHLRANGSLLLEHGCDQGAQVRSLLTSAGFIGVTTEVDLAGLERVTCGQLQG
jgi:release factor glutamine methyltransferase